MWGLTQCWTTLFFWKVFRSLLEFTFSCDFYYSNGYHVMTFSTIESLRSHQIIIFMENVSQLATFSFDVAPIIFVTMVLYSKEVKWNELQDFFIFIPGWSRPYTACGFSLWFIWKDYNDKVFNQHTRTNFELIRFAIHAQEDFKTAYKMESSSLLIRVISRFDPSPPPLDAYWCY